MSVKTHTGNEGTREQGSNQLWLGIIFRNTIRQSAVTIADSPTKIPATPLANRRSLFLRNNGTATIFLGDDAVTTTDGYPLKPNESLPMNIEDDLDVYGIVASGTQNLRIFEGA